MRSSYFRLFALAPAACALAGGACAQPCYDVDRGEPHALDGLIEERLFAATMAEAMTGKATEPGFLLLLDAPICLTGDAAADPFLEIEILPAGASAAELRRLEGVRAHLELSPPYPATTIHQHRPLVASVERAIAAAPPEASAGVTVTRAFYRALGAGSGEAAAAQIAPESRRGPLAAQALSRFYGGLRQRLKLAFVLPQGSDRFLVRYSFAKDREVCEGRAVVTARTRGGETLIESVRALDGC